MTNEPDATGGGKTTPVVVGRSGTKRPLSKIRCSWCGDRLDPLCGTFADFDGAALCEACWGTAP